MTDTPTDGTHTAVQTPLRTIIIGAGMAGLLAAIKLKERGESDFIIYEKGDSVGGTWRENRYPGLTCDVPSHSYTYSFAYNPEWSAFFAPGPEIHGYFKDIAQRYGLIPHIRFNTEVTRCDWRDGQWHVETADGTRDQGPILVAATGVLHHPQMPDIPGLDRFGGAAFHSARWDDRIDLTGKRVGVIGTGSTGAQIVSAVSQVADQLVQFQRSAQWIMPCPDLRYTDAERAAFREDPSRIYDVRNGPEALARRARFTNAIIDANSPQLAEIQEIVERNLQDSVKDPVLREKLRPDYRVACKRLVYSAHYYAAVQQPNVIVETGAIAQIEPDGVRMRDGSFHALDVLVLATGFKVDRFVRPIKFHGEDGVDLDDSWAENPRAYYAITVPKFPNMVILNGPTGPVGNFSLIEVAERQWAYFDQLVDLVRTGKVSHFAPSEAALQAYEARRNERAMGTVFATGCNSWYLDKNGVPQVWPWSWDYFLEAMSAPRLEDYVLTPAA